MPNLPMRANPSYSPWGRGWDHTRKCMSREAAEKSRDGFKAMIGEGSGERRIKWRVRPCPACHQFYVDRDVNAYRPRNRRPKGEVA
jgi:hypothetical protein